MFPNHPAKQVKKIIIDEDADEEILCDSVNGGFFCSIMSARLATSALERLAA